MKELNLVYYIECSEPGGAERVVLLLAGGFRSRGVPVTVLVMEEGWLTERLAEAGIPFRLVLSRRGWDLSLPLRLAREVRRAGGNVLHSHLLDSNFYGALAARLARVSHLATDHGDVHLPERKKLLSTKLKIASLLGSTFTGVSQHTVRRLVNLGVRSAQVHCLYNPVGSDIQADATVRAEVRRELGAQDDTFVWMHVAMLRPVKDQRTLLAGFARSIELAASQSQLLCVIGDGPDRVALEAYAGELGIVTKVRFLGVRDDVGRLLCGGDGFILSSVSEALPMSVLEAGMAGLVVVSSSVGGVPEIIEDGKNGYLFPPRDATALGAILAKVVSERESSVRVAAEARRRFLSSFSMSAVLDQYSRLYQDLVHNRRQGRASD